MRLTERAVSLLRGRNNDSFIGVVFQNSAEIELFVAKPTVSPAREEFPGHRELLAEGIIPAAGVLGFSFEVINGHIRYFYRSSCLNAHLPLQMISMEMTDNIVVEISTVKPVAENLILFP